MPKKEKNQKHRVEYVSYQTVDTYVHNDSAYIGIVVSSRVDNIDRQYLLVTDVRAKVVDMVQIDRPGQRIPSNRPVVVLSSNEDESAYIPSGFYVNGRRQHLIDKGKDVTLDTFYDRSFGNNALPISAYEQQQIYQTALSAIDDVYKNGKYKDDLNAYLSEALNCYYNHAYDFRRANHSDYDKNQYAKIGDMEQELQAVFSDTSENSFMAEMRRNAARIHQGNAAKSTQFLYADSVDGYKSRFERTMSENALSDSLIKERYYAAAERVSADFHNQLVSTGLIDTIGKTNEESYKRITEAVEREKDLLARSIANHEPNYVIEQRKDFIFAISELSATHPQNLQHQSSRYLNVDVAEQFSELTTNRNANMRREYTDGVLKDMAAKVNSEQITDVLSIQRGYARYSFMPSLTLHATLSEHSGVRSGFASDPLTHTDRTYQDMGQREFYDYLVAKSKIVREFQSEYLERAPHKLNQYKQSDEFRKKTPTEQNSITALNFNEYHRIYRGVDDAATRTISAEERLGRVATALKEKLGIPDSTGVDRFLQSDEFARLVKSPESMFVKKGNSYLTCINNTISETASPTLRPEYAVDVSRFDIHTAAGCQKLQDEIKSQIQFDSLIHERPAQELREMQQFVTDHVQYNEAVKSAEFNHRISNGLDRENIRYSELTQHILNDVNHANIREHLRTLNEAGITDVDFQSKPNAYQVIRNYESLNNIHTKIDDNALELANRIAANLRGGHVTASAHEIAQKIEANLDAIKSTFGAREKAELIIDTLSIEHKGNLFRSDIAEITKYGNIVEMERIGQYRDIAEDLKPLVESLKPTIISDISYTRGCDSFVREDDGSIRKVNLYANETAVANKMDIATAIHTNPSENAHDVAIGVMENHEIRNRLIDELQDAVAYSGDYFKSKARINIFNALHDLPVGVTDAKSSINFNDRAEALTKAFDIKLSDDDKTRATEVTILNSPEVLNAIRELQEKIVTENYATTKADYMLRLEKTNGIEKYKQLINELRDHDQYDISRIADVRYMAYVKEDLIRSGSDQTIVDRIDTIQSENNYVRLLTTYRNIEDLSHRGSLTIIESDALKRIGSDIAFQTAMQDIGNDDSVGTTSSRIVKDHLYQQMIQEAADTHHSSTFMGRKMESETAALRVSAKAVTENLDIALQGTSTISNGVSLPISEGSKTSASQYIVRGAIRSDFESEALKEDLIRIMQGNKNYPDYLKNNNHGETLKQIEGIERELQFKRDCEKTAMYMVDDYHSKAHGIHAKRYAKCEAGEIERLETLRLEIKELEQRKYDLEDSIRNTYGNVDKRLLDERREFHRNATLENASTYADRLLNVYATNALERNMYRYPDRTDNNTYECLRLCENLKSSTIPMSVRMDSYNVRIALAEEARNLCAEEARQICDQRISDIGRAFQPDAKTVITPSLIQAAIDTSNSKLEAASPTESVKIRHDIERYTALRDELTTVQNIRNELDASNLSQSLINMAAKMNVSTYHISEQYAEANRHLESAHADKKELERFEAARNAYVGLDHISERTLHMSLAERSNAVDAIFADQKIMSYTEIADRICQSEKPIAQSTEMKNYLQVYKELHASKASIDILMEKLETSQDRRTMLDLNEEDKNALRKINNYNQAIEALKPHAKEVREISLEIAGTKSGTNVIAREMYRQLDAPHLQQYVNHYIKETSARTLVDSYMALDDNAKKENIVSVVNAINNQQEESATNQWPATNAKFALMTMSEFGLDKAVSLLGDEFTAMMATDDVINFYKSNMKNLFQESSVESKQVFAECERMARSVPEEEDSKHAIVLKALDDAHAADDAYAI